MDDLHFKTATQIASLIRDGELSSLEITSAYLSRIDTHNRALNAVVTINDDGAIEAANQADKALKQGKMLGPLHGVPVTIKDVYATAGIKSTGSSKKMADYVPDFDATIVARLKQAGAIILGKTNMPMMNMDMEASPPLFGRSNNPWNIHYSTGGSSGGGAAAIAAGFSALEIGSDVGGSVRVPAHYCGVYAFKPTEHVVPDTGHIYGFPEAPRPMRHLETPGPIARSVTDLKTAFTIMAGPDGHESEVAPIDWPTVEEMDLASYKIAWTDRFADVPINQATYQAIHKLANHLVQQVKAMELVSPIGFDMQSAWNCWGEILGAEVGSSMPWFPRALLKLNFNLQQAGHSKIKKGVMHGLKIKMRHYSQALDERDRFIEKLESFFQQWDAWICPVSPTPAFTHCRTGKRLQVDNVSVPYLEGLISYTSIFNLTGHPVVTMPLTQTAQGLPIGFQIVGKRWGDLQLLAIAEAISKTLAPLAHPVL